jgi:hypothetical protein
MKFYRFATKQEAKDALDRIETHVVATMESEDLIWLPRFKCFIERKQIEKLCEKQRGWTEVLRFKGDFYLMAHPAVDLSDVANIEQFDLDGRFFSEDERRQARNVQDFVIRGQN